MINAITRNIDEPAEAVDEILEQLDMESRLLENSVGILACETEYVGSGVIEELCARVPFDVAGITTSGSGASGVYGPDVLTLSVLTSDDVRFSTAMSESISRVNIEKPVRDAFDKCRSKYPGETPSFILAYPPLIMSMGGNRVFTEIREQAGDIPLFGSLSCDGTLRFTSCETFWNGHALPDAMALIFMYGNVKPRFFVTSIPNASAHSQYGIITGSESEMVTRVGGMSFIDYLDTLHLSIQKLDTFYAIPFLVRYTHESPPLARALYHITPQRHGVFGGDMPENSLLSVGSLGYDGIMETAEKTLTDLLDGIDGHACALIVSCVARQLLLGLNGGDEMKKTADRIGGRVAYQFSYSGGEICPVRNAEGELVNNIHNYTFAACVF
jgi:hypothetical protein